jgi:hypothetical protein
MLAARGARHRYVAIKLQSFEAFRVALSPSTVCVVVRGTVDVFSAPNATARADQVYTAGFLPEPAKEYPGLSARPAPGRCLLAMVQIEAKASKV